jgi:hypothetical protein
MSKDELYAHLHARQRLLRESGQGTPQYGDSHHQCVHCRREILQPPNIRGSSWYQPMKASFGEALAASASACPLFQWIVDEVVRSQSPLEHLTLAMNFKCGLNDAVDIYSSEIIVQTTPNYSWPAARFDILADYGMRRAHNQFEHD